MMNVKDGLNNLLLFGIYAALEYSFCSFLFLGKGTVSVTQW